MIDFANADASDIGALQRYLLSLGGKDAMLARAVELGFGVNNVQVDAPLENVLVAYENRELIADEVMPVLEVKKKSGLYRRLKPDTMFNMPQAMITSSEARPNRAQYALDTNATYACKDYGLLDFIGADEIANAQAPIEPRMIAEDIILGFLMLAREYRVAQIAFAAASYGANTAALTGDDRWDDPDSDPVTKINTVLRSPLIRPNKMVIGEEAWDYLRNHEKVKAFILARPSAGGKPTPLVVDEETVARAFRLDKVVVGTAIYNTAREGATASYSRMWGKSCALIRVEPKPNARRTQTFGYTMRWTLDRPAFAIQEIYDQMPGLSGGTWIKGTHCDDENVVGGANVGYLLTTVIS